MKRLLYVVSIAFATTLAVVIGTRISPDALGVVVGIVCGVLASIPTTAILVWVLRQRDKQMEVQMAHRGGFGHYPPVVVVNGQAPNGAAGAHPHPALPSSTTLSGPRNFKVIGQENTEITGDVLPPFWDDL